MKRYFIALFLFNFFTLSAQNSYEIDSSSLTSRLITLTLDIFNFKSNIEESFQNPPRNENNFIPDSIGKLFEANIHTIQNKTVVTLSPKERLSNNHIIFLHGGAYVHEISEAQWNLATTLAQKSMSKVTVIDYPLAPTYSYKETFLMLEESYRWLIQNYPDDEFIFIGDSAGGGLALAFTQYLIKSSPLRLPTKNILLSPWIDLSMTNPKLIEAEKEDVILSIKGLEYCARLYAKNEDLKQYQLSPLYGSFENLPKTLLFYGGKELFYPDFEILREKATAQNIPIIFYKYTHMQHDWVLFPIFEAQDSIEKIVDFIKE